MAEPATHAVFLSYAREDTDAARRIADALRAFGMEVWFDQNEPLDRLGALSPSNGLRGGDAWDQTIRRQIKECALFVPVISANTQARAEGYFRLEWRLADQRTHLMGKSKAFLLPICIDATRETEADVPDSFSAVQWTRLPSGEPTPAFCTRVQNLLVREGGSRASSPAGASAEKESAVDPITLHASAPRPEVGRALRARPLWLVGMAIGTLVVALGLVWRNRHTTVDRPSEPAAARPAIAQGFGGQGNAPPSPAAAQPPLDFATAKSIAVLPFVNLGADKADDYLGDGMTEELLNVLAKVKGLRVPGRSSSFSFKGRTDPDIFRQVGQQLRVSTVLEGSVRKSGNRVRIAAQLINVADGFHLWSENYERDLTDLLAIQSDVAQRVVQALQVTLGVEESRALAKKPTDNPEAHRLYLLGRHHWHRNNEAGWQNAIKYFEEAIRLDLTYAPAYIGLADTYSWMAGNVMSGREGSGKQVQLARQALAIEPDSADAHASMALGLAGDFDWPGAEQAVRRALQLNPNLGRAHDAHGYLLLTRGMADEAVAAQRAAVAVDPLSPLLNLNLAWGLYFARRDEEAIAQIRKTQELEANFGHGLMGLIHCWRAEFTEAVTETEIAKSAIFRPRIQADLGYIYAMSGDRGKAQAVLSELDALARRRYVQPGARVRVHLGLGEHDKVFELLEWCAAERDSVCFELKVDRAYDSLRSDRRYQALLKKIGLE